MTYETSILQPLPFELSDEDCARIKSELAPDERLLWASRGRPRGLPFRGPYLLATIVGVILFGLGIPASERKLPVGESFGILLLVVGALVLIGTLVSWVGEAIRLLNLQRKIYALTDRRLVIWKPSFPPGSLKLSALHRGDYLKIERLLLPDGTEDLSFGEGMKCEGIVNGAAVERLARAVLVDPKSVLYGLARLLQDYIGMYGDE